MSVHTCAHLVICVTFGDIFKMKHSYCVLERKSCESCDGTEVSMAIYRNDLGGTWLMG